MTQKQPDATRSALFVVYLTVFIDLMGFGIILPLLPFYARELGATGLMVGVLMTSYSAAQFLGAPIIGRLSDRYGRRPVILATLAGSAVSLLVMGLASSLALLIVARSLAGLFGGSISAAQAYIADVTLPEQRSKYMGILGASIGMGFVFGPAIGAGLSHFGLGTAAMVAAALAGCNWVFAYVKLKETRKVDVLRGARPHLSFAGLASALTAPGKRAVLIGMFCATFAFVAMETTYALLGARRFNMTPRDLGYIFTLLGVIVVLIQGGLIGRLTKRFKERAIARAGLVTMAVGIFLVPLMSGLSGSVAALALLAAGQALTTPTLSALLSRLTSADEQGGTMGLGQSLQALARGVSPVVAGALFDHGEHGPYFLGAIVCVTAASLVLSVNVTLPPSEGQNNLS